VLLQLQHVEHLRVQHQLLQHLQLRLTVTTGKGPMTMVTLATELHRLEAETFEIHDVSEAELALTEEPVESTCCSCSTSSTCGCSTSCSSTSSCG